MAKFLSDQEFEKRYGRESGTVAIPPSSRSFISDEEFNKSRISLPSPTDSLPRMQTPEEKATPLTGVQAFAKGFREAPGFFETQKSVIKSAGRTVAGLAKALFNPIETLTVIGRGVAGGVHKLIPPNIEKMSPKQFESYQKSKTVAEAIGSTYKQKYGTLQGFEQSLREDPIGILLDASIVLGAAGGTLKTAGEVAKLPAIAEIGAKVGTISSAIDPFQAATRASGAVARGIAKGRTLFPGGGIEAKATETFQKYGVTPPLSATTPGRFPHAVEAVVATGPFGGKTQATLEAAQTKLTQVADTTVAKVGKSTDPVQSGKIVSDGMETWYKTTNEVKDALYKQAGVAIKDSPAVTVQPTETLKIVDEIIAKAESAARGGHVDRKSVGFFLGKKELWSQPNLNAYDVKNAVDQLNRMVKDFDNPITKGFQGDLKRMIATLEKEANEAISTQRPDIYAQIQAAEQSFKASREIMEKTFSDKIFDLTGKGERDRIISSIMNPTTSEELIPVIFETVGKEGIDAIRASVLENIFKKARGATPTGTFTPQGLQRQIQLFGRSRLERILTPEQLQALDDLNTMTVAIGKGQKMAVGSPTAFLGRIGVYGSAATIGLARAIQTGNPLHLLEGFLPILTDYGLSKLVNTAKGQQFLREGVKFTGATGEALQRLAPSVSPAKFLVPTEAGRETVRSFNQP